MEGSDFWITINVMSFESKTSHMYLPLVSDRGIIDEHFDTSLSSVRIATRVTEHFQKLKKLPFYRLQMAISRKLVIIFS